MDPEGPGRTGEGVWVGPSSKGIAWSDLGFRKVTLHKRCDYRRWIGGHPMEAGRPLRMRWQSLGKC